MAVMEDALVSLRPSQTSRGQAWLHNFAAADRDVAARLADSVQVVSPTQMSLGLKAQLERLGQELHGGTGLLLPVLGVDDIDRTLEELAEMDGRGWKPPDQHTAWETFQPGMPIAATPGSEGAIGNLVRDLTGDTPGREPSHWLHPRTGIETLRTRRCHMLVLLTDYAGWGTQAIRFARTLVRNKHIRSWRSSGWLRIQVLPYAASLDALQRMDSSPCVDRVEPAHPALSFDSAQWTTEERARIEDVCRRYLPGSERRFALGYRESAGLFLTHSCVPNNLPRILWRSAPGWNPLFASPSGRGLPPDLALELQTYTAPDRDLSKIALAANQQRIARAIASGRMRTPTDLLVATLALLAQGGADLASLSSELARPQSEVEEFVAFLTRAGLVNSELRVTVAGRLELRHARRLERAASAALSGSDDPYYPRTLR